MSSVAAVKPEIAFDEFQRVDIRVGTIRDVSEVAGSKKLLRLTVDFGDRLRSILSGMKGERSDPQAIVGVQTLFDIGYADGIPPALALPERRVPDGSRVG